MSTRLAAIAVFAVLTSACAIPPDGAIEFDESTATADREAEVPPADREVVCQAFIDATLPLGEPGISHADYQRTLAVATQPLMVMAVGDERLSDDQALLASLERIYAGDAVLDDLWTIEELGGILAGDGGSICEELGINVGYMPPPPDTGWDTPPEVDVVSAFAPGTADHACDVFIQTIDLWVDDANIGAEYGPDMADQVDQLIAALEELGVDVGLDQLAVVSEKWRTLHWVRGQEESGRPLMEAATELVPVAPRCGDLFQALTFDREPSAPPPDYSVRVLEVVAVSEFDPGQNCGNAQVPGGEPIPPTQPLDDDSRQALAALFAVGPEGESFVSGYQYRVFSRTANELVLLGTAPDGALSDAYFQRIDGRWEPQTFGGCRWRPTGFNVAEWQPHPGHQLARESSVIELLAVDDCGVVFERNHEVVVVAEYSDGAIEIEVWEASNPPADSIGYSDLSCVIGATIRLSVRLPEPLGDRELVGASNSLAP